jgi:hypothetical protein
MSVVAIGDVVGDHAASGEPRRHRGAAGAPVERGGRGDGGDRLLDPGAEEPGDAVVDDLGRRTAPGYARFGFS